jgi:hypothetical protein
MDQLKWGSQRSDQYGTWLGAVLFPARQGESFLDILEFNRKDFRDRLLQPALFGPGSIFKLEHGVKTGEESNALVFSQEISRQGLGKLAIHTDGVLVYGSSLSRDSRSFSLANMYMIDELEIEQLLATFLTYAEGYYKSLPRGEVISSLYIGVSLTGVDNKTFGKLPSQSSNSFSVPSHNLPNPLKAPPTPVQISRAELSNPAVLARKMTEHIARLFRNANAYFTPNSGRT